MRLLIFRQQFFPQPVGFHRCGFPATLEPGIVIVPVGNQRLIEGGLIALQRMGRAEEVARRADVGEKTLFRALSENGNPTVATLHKVLHAVGLQIGRAHV